MQMNIIKKGLMAVMVIFLLTSCLSYDFARKIVQQGNILSPAKIAQLKVGMSKEDVAIIMGTSLLSPLFTNDRWDYAYTWRRGSGATMKRYLTIYFSANRVVRIEHQP